MTVSHAGFADPVLDSQACFRAVLDAMARPGTVHELRAPADPPPPLHRATAAALLTLVDAETPLWMDAAAATAAEWVAFHCGASAAAPERAAFGVALAPVALDRFCAGSDEGPEQSATIIMQVRALGAGPVYRLEGPGLAAPATLAIDGLAPGFLAEWAANMAMFPRGIDVILCAGDRIAAFPRTLRLEPGDGSTLTAHADGLTLMAPH
jgi:alpha-D-ribose 1-methylphosphonate 5-triphosphate synthase subunit PhnH